MQCHQYNAFNAIKTINAINAINALQPINAMHHCYQCNTINKKLSMLSKLTMLSMPSLHCNHYINATFAMIPIQIQCNQCNNNVTNAMLSMKTITVTYAMLSMQFKIQWNQCIASNAMPSLLPYNAINALQPPYQCYQNITPKHKCKLCYDTNSLQQYYQYTDFGHPNSWMFSSCT